MAPLESMNNDEAFLSLLSSQRELLNRLNMDNAIRREHQTDGQFSAQYSAQYSAPYSAQFPAQFSARKIGSMLEVDPFSLMNTPIIERRGSLDMLFSKRLSLNMGNDNLMMSTMPNEFDESSKFKDVGFGDAMLKKMKRRRSSLGLLSAAIMVDDSQLSRRLSMMSSFSRRTADGEDNFEDDLSFFENPEPVGKRAKLDPSIDLTQLKSTMEDFSSAMENSTKSQQDIHDWDRKMGLKRSHSKTMRLSMRSRKKLRLILKKEINSLAHPR
jgi:hypothetical protein